MPLKLDDENLIRKSVYEKNFELASSKGLLGEIPEIVLPMNVMNIYNKNPFGTIRLLILIAEGSNPSDSIMANIYSITLISKHGLSSADLLLNKIKIKTYDSIKPETTITWRMHWVGAVKRLSKENKINIDIEFGK